MLNAPPYFCHQCKKVIDSLPDLLFVEEGSGRGFCTEKCIEEFFRPLMVYYQKQSDDHRKELKLDEDHEALKEKYSEHFENLFERPEEVWVLENEISEKLYVVISRLEDGPYLIGLTTFFSGSVSFIYFSSVSFSEEYLKFWRVGEKVTNVESLLNKIPDVEKDLMETFSEDIEMLKSELLAELLENHQESDIGAEKYALYDKYLELTMDNADDVYRYKSPYGPELVSLIKGHEDEGVSFYYIVTCFVADLSSEESGNEVLVPILGFPTIDGGLCSLYRKGDQVLGTLRS